MIDSTEEYDKMAAVEGRLWWYKTLHQNVVNQLKKDKIEKTSHILDAGCGTGGLIKVLKKAGYRNIKGIDLSETAVRYCKNDNLDVVQGKVEDIKKHFNPGEFDMIISNDVLCYFKIGEQVEILKNYETLLKPHGAILLNLPAFKRFSGIHDISVGIQHRFEKSNLELFKKIEQIKIDNYYFWPFFLSPFIYYLRLLQRIRLKKKENVKITSDVNLPPNWLNSFFYWVTKFELNFSQFSPLGSSIFIVLRKNNS